MFLHCSLIILIQASIKSAEPRFGSDKISGKEKYIYIKNSGSLIIGLSFRKEKNVFLAFEGYV